MKKILIVPEYLSKVKRGLCPVPKQGFFCTCFVYAIFNVLQFLTVALTFDFKKKKA